MQKPHIYTSAAALVLLAVGLMSMSLETPPGSPAQEPSGREMADFPAGGQGQGQPTPGSFEDPQELADALNAEIALRNAVYEAVRIYGQHAYDDILESMQRGLEAHERANH